jgi:hypothetical protein
MSDEFNGLCYLDVLRVILDKPGIVLPTKKARKLAWQAMREGFQLDEQELVQALEIDTHMVAEAVEGGYRFKTRA